MVHQERKTGLGDIDYYPVRADILDRVGRRSRSIPGAPQRRPERLGLSQEFVTTLRVSRMPLFLM